MTPLAEPGKSFGQRLQSAVADALIGGVITFLLFCLLLGVRTVDTVTGLTLKPRPMLLAVAVGIVVIGRFLLSLFVWHADYPATTPFAKLFTRERFDRLDLIVLGSVAGVAALTLIIASIGPRINGHRIAASPKIPPRQVKKVNRLFQNPVAHALNVIAPTFRTQTIRVAP